MNYDLTNMTPKDLENAIKFLQTLLGNTLENKNTISKVVNQESKYMECPHCHCSDCIIKSGFLKIKYKDIYAKNVIKNLLVQQILFVIELNFLLEIGNYFLNVCQIAYQLEKLLLK